MTLEQEAAYLRLLWNCWQERSIPTDKAKLAAICKNTPIAKFEAEIWPALSVCFTSAAEGRLVHHKVELLRAAKDARRNTNSKAGRLGAEKRWHGMEGGVDTLAMANATTSPSDSDSKPISADCRLPNTDCRLPSTWSTFSKLYPVHRLDERKARQAFESREAEADAILAGLSLAVTSTDWTKEGGRFVPKASNFIQDGKFKDAPRWRQPGEEPSPYRRYVSPSPRPKEE